MHRAHWRADLCPTGVLKTVARLEHRLFADHTGTAHLLGLVIGIGDDPVAADQLGAAGTRIADRDRIGEHIALRAGIGMLGQITDFG